MVVDGGLHEETQSSDNSLRMGFYRQLFHCFDVQGNHKIKKQCIRYRYVLVD